MKWSLMELNKYQETPLQFDETLDAKSSLMARDKLILSIAPVRVTGFVSAGKSEYILHYTVETVITLPSSRSLEPVELPLLFDVDEVFMTEEQYQRRNGLISDEEILLLEKSTIDLAESVEDNILLAIPIQVLSEEEQRSSDLPKGADWEVVSEEEYLRKQEEAAETQVDPRLAKLSELFSNDDDL